MKTEMKRAREKQKKERIEPGPFAVFSSIVVFMLAFFRCLFAWSKFFPSF